MGFTIEEGQESYPLFSPASHCPLTVRTLETSGPNRDPRTDAARILQEHLPTGEWFRLLFTLECSAARPEFLSVLVLWQYKIQNLLFYWRIDLFNSVSLLSLYLPSITEEITQTDDADLVHHLAGAHGESADAVSVQFPWSQWIVQPPGGTLCHCHYNGKVMRPVPEVTES